MLFLSPNYVKMLMENIFHRNYNRQLLSYDDLLELSH